MNSLNLFRNAGILIFCVIFVLPSCADKDNETKTPAALTTLEVTAVTATSATAGGNITDAGDPAYTERGVCYAATVAPTVADTKIAIEGTGTGTFTVNLTGLTPNVAYYVRAYATGDAGTSYGNEVSFTTTAQLSSECNILSFSYDGIEWTVSGVIVSAEYPAGTDLSAIAPVIAVSPGAGISPASETYHDFSDGKQTAYTVTAEDGVTAKTYTAQATVAGSAPKQMTMTTKASDVGFTVTGNGEMIIDWGDGNEYVYVISSVYTAYMHAYFGASVHNITITGENITGIDFYYDPVTFIFFDNQLTELDVSKNNALIYLNCENNQLTELDVSKNTALIGLSCYNNQLTELDVSNNTALIGLYCGNNQLTELDVSKNTALRFLHCYDNLLTTLDASNNTALTYLSCGDNQLTELDVSDNTALTSLSCSANRLTKLDVSNNTALSQLYCSANQLNAAALNALFDALPVVSSGSIHINSNPGTDDCDPSIAEAKGWEVNM